MRIIPFFFQLCGLSDSDLRERTVEELDIAFDNIAEKHYKEAEVKGQILVQQNKQIPKHSIYKRYFIFKMICICDLLNSSQHNYLEQKCLVAIIRCPYFWLSLV